MLFSNAGKKIKIVAVVLFVLSGLAGSVFSVAAVISGDYSSHTVTDVVAVIFLTIIAVIVSWVVAWVPALLLYGFGDLVENTCENKEKE